MATSFLDLYINCSDDDNVYDTYRKPMCTYDYLPFTSWHGKHCKLGIFEGELVRLLRTNKYQQTFERDVEFTFRKLIDRGYCRTALRCIRPQYAWTSRHDRLAPKVAAAKNKELYLFKIRFPDAVRKIGVGRMPAGQAVWLPESFLQRHRILVCHVSNKKLFRLRYRRFL